MDKAKIISIIIVTSLLNFLLVTTASAQIKIGDNPDNIDDGSALEIESTNKAFVLPRMNVEQRSTIPTPLVSAMIYSTTHQCVQYYDGTTWDCVDSDTYLGNANQTLISDRIINIGSYNLSINAASTQADILRLYRANSSPNEPIQLKFDAQNSSNTQTTYGLLSIEATDVSGSSGDGSFSIQLLQDNTLTDVVEISSNGSTRLSKYGQGTFTNTTADYLLAVEADGDVTETNLAKAARFFYAPSLIIDASSTGTNQTLDLYAQYLSQFQNPMASSSGAPASIPYYAANELYYYITYFDNTILDVDSISDTGVLQYDILSVPTNDYTQINVVFVVK